MKIGIAADHGGYKLKEKLKKYFNKKNIEYIDYGTDSLETTDYNDFAIKVCDAVNNGDVTYGVLICKSGIGMSIMANKVKGIMCAKVDNALEARLAKEHNNANVISFSASLLYFEAKDVIDSYLSASFSDNERYVRRVNKILEYEKASSNKKNK